MPNEAAVEARAAVEGAACGNAILKVTAAWHLIDSRCVARDLSFGLLRAVLNPEIRKTFSTVPASL